MSYAEAIAGLQALGAELFAVGGGTAGAPRRRFDLEQMRVLATALDSPERRFRSVLVAGTNGKGSTAAMLASIVRTAGYRVGLYTSPHLARVNERIQIDGAAIADEDFARVYFRVEQASARLVNEGRLPQHPSFFETVTAIAFLYFAEREVELAVLEVGIGGRLDATNIVEPLLSVITDISLDHTEWLGDTIAAIAREKAGILRRNGILVTLPQHPEANQTLGEAAEALGARGVNAAAYMPAGPTANEPGSGTAYEISVAGERVEIHPPLAGSHQFRNIALAVAAAEDLCNSYGYKITPANIATGVGATRWPGRLELFPSSGRRPAILLDVAHNPAGAWSLRSALSGVPQLGPRTLLFGCLRDKAVREMAQILFPVFDRVVLTPVDSPRTAGMDELAAAAAATGAAALAAASPAAALDLALELTPGDGLVVCAGSVYLVGALRERIVSQYGESC